MKDISINAKSLVFPLNVDNHLIQAIGSCGDRRLACLPD